MTILILNEKAFATKYITAINNNAKMTEALAEVCPLWIDDKNSDAKQALENFYDKIKHSPKAIAKFKQQLSIASKKVRKANGIEKPAGLRINKEGILEDAPMRNSSPAKAVTGSGDGESTGETDSTTTESAKSAPMFDKIALLSSIKILDALIAKESDEKTLEGLRYTLYVLITNAESAQ